MGGVDRFRVLGIESSAGLDPNNVTAFVTGLAFVTDGQFTGTMTPIIAQAHCSTLGNDKNHWLLDLDIFTFQGAQGEEVFVGLEKAENDLSGNRATLMLVDAIRGAHLFRIDRGGLPNEVEATLPATGKYLVIVSEQPRFARGIRFKGDYCISVQSSGGAAQTLAPTAWVEDGF